MNLRTERKWCLTGTPVQNSLDDLFTLTEFLAFYPVDNRLNARRWILDPLGAKDENSIENFRLLIRSATLRRSRDSERNGRRSELEVKVILSSAERELYNSIRSKARTCLSPHDRFSYILRMRQVCSHGLREQGQRFGNAEAAQDVQDGPTVCHRCGVYFSLMALRIPTLKMTNTPHFCLECADEQNGTTHSITESASVQDSTCEEPSTPVSDLIVGVFDDTGDTDVDMDRDQITPEISKSSAKILALMDNLLKLQLERHQDSTPIKR